MSTMKPTNTSDLDRLIEEGRKRGYVRRAELESVLQRMPKATGEVRTDAPQANKTDSVPEIEELSDLDAAVEQLLAADVDIVDDEEEEAR